MSAETKPQKDYGKFGAKGAKPKTHPLQTDYAIKYQSRHTGEGRYPVKWQYFVSKFDALMMDYL